MRPCRIDVQALSVLRSLPTVFGTFANSAVQLWFGNRAWLPRYGLTCVSLASFLLLVFPMLSAGKSLIYGIPENYPQDALIAVLERYVGGNDVVFADNGLI